MKFTLPVVGLIALSCSPTFAQEVGNTHNKNAVKNDTNNNIIKPNNATTATTATTANNPTNKNTIADESKTKNASKPITENSEVYDITINDNWSFSGLLITDGKDLYIPLKFLPSEMLSNLTDKYYVDYKNTRSLKFDASSVIKRDDENLVVAINLSEGYFKDQTVNLKNQEAKPLSVPINALFVNYDINIDPQKLGDTRATFNANWASENNSILRNYFFWDKDHVVRLNSTWQKNFKDNSGLILGDTYGASLSGFNSLNFLGARYSTSYYNGANYLQDALPTLSISGFAVNPSKLDLYINGQSIEKSEIASGRYNLNIPYQGVGYGLAQAYVYDITGKPNIVSVPFYNSSDIIKKGQHEYDISGGFIRKNYGTDSFNYSSPIVNLLYKGGWAEGYTQDLYGQFSPLYSVVSSLSHWIPNPNVGVINAGISYNSQRQYLYRLGLERVNTKIAAGIDYQRGNNFCFGYNQRCLKNQLQVFGGFRLPGQWGSVSMNFVSRKDSDDDIKISSLQWNRQLTQALSLTTNFSSSTGKDGKNKSLYIGLSMPIGKRFFGNSSYTYDKKMNSFQESVYMQPDNDHPERGYGSLTYNKGLNNNVNLYYGANLDKFSYQTNITKNDNGTTANLDLSGSVTYIPESKYFTFGRQILNGLTYVKVENLNEPAEIYSENKLSGKTNKNGDFVIPDVTPLTTSNVYIDVNKLSGKVTLEDYKKQYTIPSSGVSKVTFKAKPLPFIINIKGVEPGAIFNIGKEFYVVGDGGLTAVDAIGKATLPLKGGGTCEIEVKTGQKDYVCK